MTPFIGKPKAEKSIETECRLVAWDGVGSGRGAAKGYSASFEVMKISKTDICDVLAYLLHILKTLALGMVFPLGPWYLQPGEEVKIQVSVATTLLPPIM